MASKRGKEPGEEVKRGRMQGTPLRNKDGRITGWRVRVAYETLTGAKKVKGFERETLQAAQDAAFEWLARHGRAQERPEGGTVSQAVEAVDRDLWAQFRGKSTRKDYQRCSRAFETAFGPRPIAEITAPQLTNYFKRYVDGSKRGMDEHWKAIKSVFDYAASDLGWIVANPMKAARKPKATGEGRDWPVLVREQFNQILPHLDPMMQIFYRLLGETGARPSEAWTLNTETRLTFHRDVWWFVVEIGKTDAATRRIPIPDSLYRDLIAAGPEPFKSIASAKSPATYVLWRWKAAMKAAGIAYTRPYEVRAMRINEWRRMKVDKMVRKSMVGHTSEKTTNDWYDFVDADEVLKALQIAPDGTDDACEK